MSALREHPEANPFTAYRLLSLTFNAVLLGLALSKRSQRRFERPLSLPDFAMIAASTHKLALIVTGERVTQPLRAAFAERREEDPEHKETSRGQGLRRALGELVTCPYCMAPWITTALVAGHVLAPQPTRAVTTVFSAVAASDWMSQVHTNVRVEREEGKAKKRLFEEEAKTLAREAPPQAES